MTNKEYCKNFVFKTFSFSSYRHTDHRKGIETHYIARLIRGTSKFVYNGGEFNFKSGDVFYIPKGLCYQSYWYGDDNGIIEFDSIGFKIFPDASEKNTLFKN